MRYHPSIFVINGEKLTKPNSLTVDRNMTTDELQVIRDFNRNVSWLKTMDLKKAPKYTAQQLTKITGWDKETLRRKRDRKEIEFTRCSTGGYRYQYSQSS